MRSIFVFILLLAATSVYSQKWYTNYTEAQKQATKQGKNIVMVFSGSDWCAPCIKLEKEIWQSNEFKQFAEKHWILVKVDFPRTRKNKLPKPQLKHNENLASKHNKKGYFPMVVLLSPEGKTLGKTGYKKMAPLAYINHLKSFK
ncbi:thioredoxin family protein [Prolixibacteraceae bacterium JC049]|nr:thioredoxin family protein [Prolixibacteraceae bacterium JC049]